MKKAIAWPTCWLLYWLGDGLSKIMNVPEEYGGRLTWWLYRPYNFCMCRSLDIQDWAGIKNGPWESV